MSDDLPTEFDVIVVGTGLVESIVAAASSRIGKKVLHLDGNSYYGQLWATFNLEHFEQWFNQINNPEKKKLTSEKTLLKNTQFTQFETLKGEHTVSNLKWTWFISNDKEDVIQENIAQDTSSEKDDNLHISNENVWLYSKLKNCSQKFNIDLSPRVIFSKGPMVDLIIKSGVSHYVDFVSVHNVLLYLNSIVEAVPYSKSDVFSTRSVSVVEKRLLMKLLQEIQEYNPQTENEKNKNETFHEYLKKYQISENIEKYIVHAIARVSSQSVCDEGIKAAQIFLNSLGVYGNSPYLWPLYGSSELAQAFCRLCAVYGGIYCLNREVDAILTDGSKCVGILSENKELLAEHVVMTTSYTPSEFFLDAESKETLSRAILITDQSLYVSGKKGVSIMQVPSEESNIPPITVIQLDSSTNACPSGLYIVHLTTLGPINDFVQFDKVVQELFVPFGKCPENASSNEKKKPTLLFKLYFNVNQINSKPSEVKPKNFYSCTNPVHNELDFFNALKAARRIFEEMYPDQEFLTAPVKNSDVDLNDEFFSAI